MPILPRTLPALLDPQVEPVLQTMLRAAERGIDAVGADGVVGHRLANMHSFYSHLLRELPAVLDRWRKNKESPR